MAPKRKRLQNAPSIRPAELLFSPADRNEYLTGFHKRKQARIQSAREAAAKRDKEDKVRERKQLREQRRADLESHVAAVNSELRKQNALLDGREDTSEGEEEEEADGLGEGPLEEPGNNLPEDEEYVDEDKYTTVTVEPMGGEDVGEDDGEEQQVAPETATTGGEPKKKKRPWASADGKAKAKKKKFRYESKAERTITRQKQKSKNRAAKARRTG